MAESNKTVVVGCKLPHGLQVNARPRVAKTTLEGQPIAGEYHPAITQVLQLNGSNHESARSAGGFGLTPNVDKDVFDAFLATHEDAEYVQNELVFAQPNLPSAQAKGRELSGEKTGLEGLDADKPMPGVERDKEAEKAAKAAG